MNLGLGRQRRLGRGPRHPAGLHRRRPGARQRLGGGREGGRPCRWPPTPSVTAKSTTRRDSPRRCKELFGESGLTKRVRVGIANQRTVLRTLELPPVTDAKELAAAVNFQAQEQVPMPLNNAVLDFHAARA